MCSCVVCVHKWVSALSTFIVCSCSYYIYAETQLKELPDVLDHLQLSELKQLCKDLKLAAPSRQSVTKASLTRLLLKHARQHRPLFATAPSSSVALLKK